AADDGGNVSSNSSPAKRNSSLKLEWYDQDSVLERLTGAIDNSLARLLPQLGTGSETGTGRDTLFLSVKPW
ncbi:MAG: hypothetical protein PVG45_04325, partial [Gammaproteobacteria bacterium]